ncbi:MAG TPA: hypothetical protein VFA93_01975 [Patescibacteria group bacterium]|nr:hypothetical protein [Patescibacteria group bacterium]
MDFSQILLIIIIVVLTLILTILGIQVFFILRDLRKITSTTNKVLTDVKSGTNVAKILGTLLAVFGGKKVGRTFVDLMGQKEKPTRIYSETEKKPLRRFFRRR